MVTGGGDESRRSFSGRLLDWGNSSRMTMFWAVVGCVCSFLCPLFWYVGEGKAVGELGPARLMAMMLSCIATEAVYRTAIVHRQHRFLRKKLPLVGEVLVVLTSGFSIAIGNATLTYADNWGGVVGRMLLSTAVFGAWEMAKPVHGFYLCLFFWTAPAMTALRLYGWNFLLGWPVITLAMMIFFIFWNAFFTHHHDSEFCLPLTN